MSKHSYACSDAARTSSDASLGSAYSKQQASRNVTVKDACEPTASRRANPETSSTVAKPENITDGVIRGRGGCGLENIK